MGRRLDRALAVSDLWRRRPRSPVGKRHVSGRQDALPVVAAVLRPDVKPIPNLRQPLLISRRPAKFIRPHIAAALQVRTFNEGPSPSSGAPPTAVPRASLWRP